MFFAFDGIDGVGKSTQVRLFGEWLRAAGRDVVDCRDPGSTRLGEAIRGILLDARGAPIARRSEMLLYMAARAQLVEEIIAPALAAGKAVVSDRFLLSNVVYQGHAGGLDPASIWKIGRVATAGVEPILSIVLDMPIDVAARRLNRELDRMENQGDDYRRRLRQGFLDEAARRSERVVVVNADQPIDKVQSDIRAAVQERLGKALASG